MIHEYALDPVVLKSWSSNERDYSEFMREYGVGSPRIISSFPKKKGSKLRSYLLREGDVDDSSLQGQRYLEMVIKIVESLIIRDSHVPASDNWSENTKAENEQSPFDVILSSEEINTPRNITPESMYKMDSIWNHKSQLNMPRTRDGLEQTVKNLLRLATNKVVIVDAFGWNRRSIDTMVAFIEFITANRVSEKLPDIYLYYKEKYGRSTPPASRVKQQIIDQLDAGRLNTNLYVYELKEKNGSDVFHNRCIFTEHGGITLGHGIDISGDPAHSDEVTLMSNEVYEKKQEQFSGDACFEIVSRSE